MNTEEEHIRRKIALLIDGDNAQARLLPQIVMEAARYGKVTVRRIYGDWTTPNMKQWKEVLNFYAFQPIQQFRYTVGKNSTDSAMIIDAMDLLHGGVVDGFCLVSSDSDYTRLATRIRESGIFVIGIGEKKTPKAFVNACDVFVYTENLDVDDSQNESESNDEPVTTGSEKETVTGKRRARRKRKKEPEPEPIPLLRRAYEMAASEDGWASLSAIGNALYQLDPGFDPRSYGHKQLSKLIRYYDKWFDLRARDIGGSTLFDVRLKNS